MPSYAKFMKDILSKRRKLGELDKVTLSEACSMLIRKGIPKKLKDRSPKFLALTVV